MKIVFVKDAFYPYLRGGGEVHTYKVAKRLVQLGHSVTVLCGKTSQFPTDSYNELRSLLDEEIIDGIKIVRTLPYKFGSSFSSLPALGKMAKILHKMTKNKEIDVINFDLYRPILPSFVATYKKVPSVLTARVLAGSDQAWSGWQHYNAPLWGKIAQLIAERIATRFPYNRIFVDSLDVKNQLKSSINKNKVVVTYNGVDLEEFDNVKVKTKKSNQVVFLGALKKRKNVLDALKTIELAQKEVKDLSFQIISDGGENEEDVLKFTKKYDFITYNKKPSFEEKIRILKESALLIFPSLKEGYPLVPLEGLACKTPFLAYAIPPMVEELSMTNGGVLAPIGDIKSMSSKLVQLLNDRNAINKFGLDGRIAVEKRFTWDVITSIEENVFEEILYEEPWN